MSIVRRATFAINANPPCFPNWVENLTKSFHALSKAYDLNDIVSYPGLNFFAGCRGSDFFSNLRNDENGDEELIFSLKTSEGENGMCTSRHIQVGYLFNLMLLVLST
eukprot:m.198673 g.198673  ORF g.198673 m.198673 type:complete len:107 (+) comp32702_c3_seq1:1448-1768(+)